MFIQCFNIKHCLLFIRKKVCCSLSLFRLGLCAPKIVRAIILYVHFIQFPFHFVEFLSPSLSLCLFLPISMKMVIICSKNVCAHHFQTWYTCLSFAFDWNESAKSVQIFEAEYNSNKNDKNWHTDETKNPLKTKRKSFCHSPFSVWILYRISFVCLYSFEILHKFRITSPYESE